MYRLLLSTTFLILTALRVLAQSEEPIQLKADAFTLGGTLALPANLKGPIPVVLIIAGSGPTDRDGNSPVPIANLGTIKAGTYKLLSDSLVRKGIAVARYDKRFSGKSILLTAKEEDLRFDTYITDAVGFLQQLKSDKRFSKVVVLGHSEGSLIGMVAAKRANADAYISVAGSGDNIASKLKTQLGVQLAADDKEQTFKALDSLKAGFTLSTLPTNIPAIKQMFRPSVQPYMISWMKYDPAEQLKALTIPVLIIQGKRDMQVKVDDAEKLKAARPTNKLVLFDQMTHTLKDIAGDDQMTNLKTYTDPGLPLTPGLASAIATFVKP
jgi:pimeloyl-ACP methyl ester carboxylesterase